MRALEEKPLTVKEIQEVISSSSGEPVEGKKECQGTSVFYHLAHFKKLGILDVVNSGGTRKYTIYKRRE